MAGLRKHGGRGHGVRACFLLWLVASVYLLFVARQVSECEGRFSIGQRIRAVRGGGDGAGLLPRASARGVSGEYLVQTDSRVCG